MTKKKGENVVIKTYWRELVLLALIAGLLAVGWGIRGVMAERDKAQADAKQAQSMLAQKTKQDKQNIKLDASAAAQAEKTQLVYRTITKEVTKYVETHPDSCALPADWVRLHNAAAAGERPTTERAGDASTGEVATTFARHDAK